MGCCCFQPFLLAKLFFFFCSSSSLPLLLLLPFVAVALGFGGRGLQATPGRIAVGWRSPRGGAEVLLAALSLVQAQPDGGD